MVQFVGVGFRLGLVDGAGGVLRRRIDREQAQIRGAAVLHVVARTGRDMDQAIPGPTALSSPSRMATPVPCTNARTWSTCSWTSMPISPPGGMLVTTTWALRPGRDDLAEEAVGLRDRDNVDVERHVIPFRVCGTQGPAHPASRSATVAAGAGRMETGSCSPPWRQGRWSGARGNAVAISGKVRASPGGAGVLRDGPWPIVTDIATGQGWAPFLPAARCRIAPGLGAAARCPLTGGAGAGRSGRPLSAIRCRRGCPTLPRRCQLPLNVERPFTRSTCGRYLLLAPVSSTPRRRRGVVGLESVSWSPRRSPPTSGRGRR